MLKIESRKLKVHSLTGRITDKTMLAAWKAVKRNKGAAGVDRVTIKGYARRLEANLESLKKNLKTRGAFKSSPLKRKYIRKGKTSKMRPLGIPCVADRIAQEVIRSLLEPIFEPQFHENSYGFRPGRGCHQAVEQVNRCLQDGYTWVVDVDIKGFFDNLEHPIILKCLRAEIADGNILDIIEKFLRSGVVEEDGKLEMTSRGTPQGGVISPLIANIVLNHLDWALESKGIKFARYADDIVCLCKTRQEAENALAYVKEMLSALSLECSPEKTKIGHRSDGFEFLGFAFKRTGISIRQKSREKLVDRLQEITTRSHNLDAEVFKEISSVLRGTIYYFCTGFSNVLTFFTKIGKWLRMRLRNMKYKVKSNLNNTRCKTKILIKRGLIDIRETCMTAKERYVISRKGKLVGVAR